MQVFGENTTSDWYYFHGDHLDTPRLLTDKDQQVVWQASYSPFGEADIAIEDVTNNFRFPGQYYDVEAGLHYNWFRTYDPKLGRYIQSDPIGLSGGVNTYAYVNGNPIIFYDPNGQQSIAIWTTRFAGGAVCFAPIPGARVLGFGLIASTMLTGSSAQDNTTASTTSTTNNGGSCQLQYPAYV